VSYKKHFFGRTGLRHGELARSIMKRYKMPYKLDIILYFLFCEFLCPFWMKISVSKFGNANVTVEHLKVEFQVIVISFVWRNLAFVIWCLTLKVTNLESVNCTGLLQYSNQLLIHSFECCNSFIINAKQKKLIIGNF
jgi:hypothetical protein